MNRIYNLFFIPRKSSFHREDESDLIYFQKHKYFADDVVLGVENVIVLPHLGASTPESEDNCAVMAVNEIRDFLENGNIKNSVNYPAVDMGVCSAAARVTIAHKNVPNMVSQFTNVFASVNANISDMIDKSRGEFAYAILDLDSAADADIVSKLEAIDGVIKVRVVK